MSNILKLIKIKKNKKAKIFYYNNNVNNREFFDIDDIKQKDIANKFLRVTIDDMYFKKDSEKSKDYELYFKDEKLDELYSISQKGHRIVFALTNEGQMESSLFGGKIGNRFHMINGLEYPLVNIGLGYKVYKSFIKTDWFYN